jgi:23S rRNA (uridine2552-2'-O)-methyltransferase
LSKSSLQWKKDHFNDSYVQQAQQEGYVSRAVYKLKQIQKKDNILKSGMTVVDLGAAPGGWCQYAGEVIGDDGKLFALDLLPLKISAGNLHFIQGDFHEQAILDELLAGIGEQKADVVLSDMAPNLSGMKAMDIPRSIYLAELAFDLACQILTPAGVLLVKVFQGAGFEALVADMRKAFKVVSIRKPEASSAKSKEIYLLAKNYKL